MHTEIVPFGTSAAIPAHGRHFSSLALEHRPSGHTLLFDCGEGTQFQLLRSDVRPSRLQGVFITHLHGDHFFGLPGLLSTLAMLGFSGRLVVVSPAGLARFMDGLPPQGAWPFPIEFVELDDSFEDGTVHEAPGYTVEARRLDHTIFAVGYRFEEKEGRPGNLDVEKARRLGLSDYRDYQQLKSGNAVTVPGGRVVRPEEVVGPAYAPESFAYVTDTRPCEGGSRLAAGVGLLYHEATFTAEYAHLAVEKGHATAEGAARVALDAGAQRLLLGHFSARVGDPGTLAEEARRIFPNTEAAEELKRYYL